MTIATTDLLTTMSLFPLTDPLTMTDWLTNDSLTHPPPSFALYQGSDPSRSPC
jgi:hypothetical protein